MIIYPYLALRGGRAVLLARGRVDDSTAYDFDPLEKAKEYAAAGAGWVHVVDLDAVVGTGDNRDLITDMIHQVPASIQVAGGIRSAEHVRDWAETGAGRVVFGTAAVKTPQVVKEISYAYPDQVAVSIDVWQGQVVIDGWRETTAFEPLGFAAQFAGWPLSQIILTDIDHDLELPESSLALLTKLASETATPVIASGFANSADEISSLKYLYNISGAIVGRGLHDGSFRLEEVLELAQPDPEPIAELV
ncbi:MAG: 1-(5-phosphoribosyl)-5-[(5-phosphoribosylamino)methylideneamino] imidazole-4-carboxamide isomerase [Paracoccaceae bacterium]|nr:1-(5-phosphoribosyl)-5-[(5-phosphoribosylamino)methylideneamino] imidazole-4-carboxamide isomerase [Paracoccaceae bacterium]